jgi:ketosteroid isomerase-like protein
MPGRTVAMTNRTGIPRHWSALGYLLVLVGPATALADPPGTTGGGAASPPSNTHGGFFSSLKQAFSEDVDRDVVWAHFDVGSAPDTHRFYCLVDPKSGKREPNGVAGEPFRRRDGTMGLKRPAISPVSCADAEQKGLLITSGYAVSKVSAPAPVVAAPAAAPPAAPASGVAVVPAAAQARGSTLRTEMEAANATFLAAYNSQSGTALKGLYTRDAMLLPPGTPPLVGADAIGTFWADRIKDGRRRNHTFEIVDVWADGRYAYQVARYTVDVVDDKDETSKVSGNTVRIFERQPDGKWLTKLHIFDAY